MHHAFGGWLGIAILGVLLMAGLCAAILLLPSTRRPKTATHAGAVSSFDQAPTASDRAGLGTYQEAHEHEDPEDAYDFDTKILTMLGQKGEPMRQREIAANLGIPEAGLSPWLAGMERRELIRRRWEASQSTYIVQLAADV
jgi:hypothetical protein